MDAPEDPAATAPAVAADDESVLPSSLPTRPRREKADFQKKLRDVPHKPGVYLMRDRLNRVIYVGKARDLRKRVGSYFMPSRKQRADLKTRALLVAIFDFEFHVVRSEPEALLLEGRLIKEFRPRYNVSFRDDKHFLLVKVNPDDPIPRFQLTRMKKDDGARYFGPFPHSGALRSTLELMRGKFGLRSCRPYQPGESDFKHCLAPTIKNCPAPCVGKISREDYKTRVLAACDFIEGHGREMVGELEEQMREAAKAMNFEKAAQLRDLIEDLKRTTAPARRFTRASLPSTLNPVADLKALGDALGLPHLPLVMECFDISNISTTHIVASMVSFRNGVPDKANYRRFRIQTVKGQNDFASMAEVIRRRYSRVLKEAGEADPDAAEFSQELPGEALVRLASAADPDRLPAPQAGDTPAGVNLTGDVLIAGPGYEADETDEELDAEEARERETEGLTVETRDAGSGPGVPGSEPAFPASEPAAPTSEVADPASEPGVAGKKPAFPPSEPAFPGSEPARRGSEPAFPASEAAVPSSKPAIPGSRAASPGSEPAFAGGQPASTTRLGRLPDLVVVDGGKGQLSSACKELQRLGLHDLPIIGLAKEFEEIFRPARPEPLRLPEDSGALRLLQRIRDEAHRFANGYHQLLMKRRVNESILDDCPGVSEARKLRLLARFGSVERIRRATVEEIAAVEGVSPRLAEEVFNYLQAH